MAVELSEPIVNGYFARLPLNESKYGSLSLQIETLEAAKLAGNDQVRLGKFLEAFTSYTQATSPYLAPSIPSPEEAGSAIDPSKMPELPETEENESEPEDTSHDAQLKEINLLRAQLHANAAVALRKLLRHTESIEQCDFAIELVPNYTKAYLRRADSHESLGSARKAMADYKKCTELEPNLIEAIAGQARVGPAAAEEEKRQLEELKGAFSGIANKFLGLFNLSTDNFQMVQDPQSGGYSVNFNPNA